MFCLDSKAICGIVQPSNADPMLAPENKYLIVTYQVSQTNDLASELAMAWDDLDMIFGSSFRKHCHILNIGFFNDGWPVNKAVQGTDYRLISPLPGLYLVGDDCKPEGYIMAEGVARSVELALAKMASDISAEKKVP
jgi:phytoene dehydrogenase-like protein